MRKKALEPSGALAPHPEDDRRERGPGQPPAAHEAPASHGLAVLPVCRWAPASDRMAPPAVPRRLEGPPVRGRRFDHGDVYVGGIPRYGTAARGNWRKVSAKMSKETRVQRHRRELSNRPNLLENMSELGGARLRCHCALGQPCRADNLVDVFCEIFQEAPPEHGARLMVSGELVGRLRRRGPKTWPAFPA